MYLPYLDDAGSVPNKNEQYFVLGGICVFERRVHWISKRLDELGAEINPNDPNSIEFHASKIFSGRDAPWNSLPRDQRIKIIKNVLSSINDEHESTVVFACAVHKESFRHVDPVELAFEDLITRFDLLLKRKYVKDGDSHRGLIIFDKSTYETSLQKLALNFRQFGTSMENY